MGAAMPVLAKGAGDATTWLSAAASQTEVDSAQDTDPVSDQIKFELLDLQDQPYQAPQLNADDQPQILIYHTHTREAYKQSGDYTYKAAGSWRTLEQDKSIVRVGDELTKLLTEKGFKVIHDTTDHEPPLHTTAYTRSLATMQKYKKQYPSITVFIDLHRDGVHAMRCWYGRGKDGQRLWRETELEGKL